MTSAARPSPSLDGRTLVEVENIADGAVDEATVFTRHESDGLPRTEYSGGTIARGRIPGARLGDSLDVRCVHVSLHRAINSGHY